VTEGIRTHPPLLETRVGAMAHSLHTPALSITRNASWWGFLPSTTSLPLVIRVTEFGGDSRPPPLPLVIRVMEGICAHHHLPLVIQVTGGICAHHHHLPRSKRELEAINIHSRFESRRVLCSSPPTTTTLLIQMQAGGELSPPPPPPPPSFKCKATTTTSPIQMQDTQ